MHEKTSVTNVQQNINTASIWPVSYKLPCPPTTNATESNYKKIVQEADWPGSLTPVTHHHYHFHFTPIPIPTWSHAQQSIPTKTQLTQNKTQHHMPQVQDTY